MPSDLIVVTGAAGGIGEAIARLSARRPHTTLILTDREESALERVAEEVAAHSGEGTQVHARPCDLAREEEVEALIEQAATLGTPRYLLHAAGVFTDRPVAQTSTEEFTRMMGVNAYGTFFLLRAMARAMMERPTEGDRGIVVVASNAVGVPRVGMGAYGASKAAASALTRSLGLELAEHGVRCNVVCPGSTDTAMQRDFWGADPEAGKRRSLHGDLVTHRLGIPLGRIATPEDVAHTVDFLASERARHVTLQEFFVDGGASLHA
ncbi:SDR family oxidoreductase [Corynebacterium lowii]|uniref:2,3-dihydro-2,3-dihydroxybenzoate dehydrogenase n=1 Tax=Corynebacterium lowii TaxID=1544413 RepID=A0A0Q1ADQ4_9CORY|nr:SDR family oxidoreductase [Corynebacterium lowii]KQB84801.1 2,3-dihydro-2,3-dihydroxybenzoate dehydrogenase [Corynebacterium lowii]MDP9851705.1 2,3-dihydro-2,3-dihydroxybenzoate dehydrogenase [Corynebacterium lowii]